MTGRWGLFRPGRRYRRPPALDDPVAKEWRALAARDRAANEDLADWSEEERERWMDGMRSQRAIAAYYTPARWPERIQAPPAWRDELLIIAAGVALAAALSDQRPDTVWAATVFYPAWSALDDLDTELRRRSARRLGVTAERLPPASTVYGGIFFFAGTFGPWAWRKFRGEPTPHPPWHVHLAGRLISAVNERRSWNAATRA